MSTLTKTANGLWSIASLFVCATLVGLFVYWAVLQRPTLQVAGDRTQREYVVTAGSVVYVENPVIPDANGGRIEYSNMLVSPDGSQRYVLPSPDMARKEAAEATKTVIPDTASNVPLYAVFIPSYVQPGTYTYKVTAQYRLNPFKTASLELPPMTIIVE